MKKVFGILALLLALNSCDDGDLTIENVDFQTVTAASCGETIYKIRDNEAMYLKMPSSENAFINEATLDGAPRVLTDGATHFHTGGVRPDWSKRFARTAKIGAHVFYRQPGAKG